MANFRGVGIVGRGAGRWALRCLAAGTLAGSLGLVGPFSTPVDAEDALLPAQISSIAYEFAPMDITIVQGQEVTYSNIDVAPHNVMAKGTHRDGRPLFGSDTITAGKWVPVNGVTTLAPGVYDFTCTLHPRMLGSLTVNQAD